MSDNQNWNTFGKQMEGALADALKTGDFKNLNRLVSQTMASAVSEAGKPFTPYSGSQAGNSAASARAEAFEVCWEGLPRAGEGLVPVRHGQSVHHPDHASHPAVVLL